MKLDPQVVQPRTLVWSSRVAALRKAGRRILSLALGEPDFPTPPHIVEAAARALRDGYTKYSAAQGLEELRAAVAEKLAADNGIPASPEEVVITPGAKNALFLGAAAVLEPGDEVVLPTPCYVSNLPILKLAEPTCRVVELPLAGPNFDLDLEALERAVTDKTRLLLLNYPNNPTGRMLNEEHEAFVVDLLRRRPGLYLISDEIYEQLPLTERKAFSPASVAEIGERVVTVNGFSKAYAMTGWRIGYVHAAKPIAERILKVHSQLNTHTATFVQKAAVAALEGPKDHLASFVGRLKRCKAIYERSGLVGSTPQGGFFAFVHLGRPSDRFCTELLESTGVAVLPGVAFGPTFDEYCRISLAVDPEEFGEALRALERALG
jgi:aspartate/methionine/tyrosine aminotransferase